MLDWRQRGAAAGSNESGLHKNLWTWDVFTGMKVNFCGIMLQTGHINFQITWEGKMRKFLHLSGEKW